MKKLAILLILHIWSLLMWAQPTITNAEDFAIGTVLKFQHCNPTGITAGGGGANQTWDFSTLIEIPDTTTEWMILPSATTHGNLFPRANLVEKYSDGKFVFVNKTASENYLVGFVDTTTTNPILSYTNSMLFAKRPISYGLILYDTFTISGSTSSGIITLEADAWGKLILPNGTHNNVLRVKISQVHPWFSNTTFVWFDGVNTSAVLKIEEQSNVEYLISQTILGLNEAPKSTFNVYPNPTANNLTFISSEFGELQFINMFGQITKQVNITTYLTHINTQYLDAGVYTLILKSSNNSTTSKQLIIKP
jgi:hypothetical protein